MRAYSEDIRSRVIEAYLVDRVSQRQVALRFNVSLGFVRKLVKHYRETGSLTPKKHGGPTRKIDKNSLQVLLRLVEREPSPPLSQLCETLAQETGLQLSRSTVSRIIRSHKSSTGSGHAKPPRFAERFLRPTGIE